MDKNLPKIIVILGPTASGKTDLGLALAKKFNGEIISADSRQVYKKMNIGTAKPPANPPLPRPSGELTADKQVYMVDSISHHLMDIVDPDADFSLADFKAMATNCIRDILHRNKLPIIVGGTGLYIWSIIDNLDIPSVAPDSELREKLEKKNLSELIAMLKETDPESAKKIDLKNPRRVLRALEVAISTGKSFFAQRTTSNPLFEALQIGINIPKEELNSRIEKRVDMQMQEGLLPETEELIKLGYTWGLPSMSGIGYRQMGYYLKGEMTLSEAVVTLKNDTKKYAKRQMTWFKRDKRIHWLKNADLDEAEKLVKDFLLKS